MSGDTRRTADFHPELRKNIVTREWVIIAKGRGKRPSDFTSDGAKAAAQVPEWDASCPFCPGNEGMTPPELFALRDGRPSESGSPGASEVPAGGAAGTRTREWIVRVVPNKFAALRSDGSDRTWQEGVYAARDGFGAHEVIVEARRHDHDIWQMEIAQVESIIEAYRQRYLAHESGETLKYVLIFRNHGVRAGNSLVHPHSQLIAAPVMPHGLQEELRGAAGYWEYLGKCVFCAMIEQESKAGRRTVLETDHFLVVTAFAGRYPFETWILPKRHSIRFADMSEEEASDLARVLKETLGRIAVCLDHPSYNYAIHTAPAAEHNVRAYHWHLEIFPRLTTPGGFELGSDIYINVTEPEEAARFLRETQVPT